MAKKAASKKNKRAFPESIRVYFPGKRVEILRELESLAKELDIPLSTLCVNILSTGHAAMRHFADAIKDPQNRLIYIGKMAVVNENGEIVNLDTQQEAAH